MQSISQNERPTGGFGCQNPGNAGCFTLSAGKPERNRLQFELRVPERELAREQRGGQCHARGLGRDGSLRHAGALRVVLLRTGQASLDCIAFLCDVRALNCRPQIRSGTLGEDGWRGRRFANGHYP
jgi:hypothetical protein